MRRALPLVLPALLIALAAFLPTTPTPNGGRTLEAWWLASVAIASTPVLLSRHPTGRLASLFLLGFAGQLALTQPHWLQYLRLHPRHYTAWLDLLAPATIALQAFFVLPIARAHLRAFLPSLRAHVTPTRLLLAALLFLACAVHYSLRVDGVMGTPRLAAQLVATAALFTLNCVHLALIAVALPDDVCQRALAALRQRVTLPQEDRPPTALDRRIPWLLAAITLLLTATLATLGYGRLPHIPDEVGYLFHAHYLAAGRLSAPVPPVPEAFDLYLLSVFDGKWYCAMSPGWPLVLAVGSLLDVEWLINPVLAALCIPVAWDITRRLADRGYAHVVATLFVVSPWFLFLGASFMTHSWSLLLTLSGWWLLLRSRDSRATLHSLLAGMCLGALFSIRSLDCLVVASITGLWCMGRWGNGPRLRFSSLAAYAVGGAMTASPVLLYNAHLTGSALTVPLNHYYDRLWYPGANRLGFGADVGNPPGGWSSLDPLIGHGWADVLLNTNQNLYNLNFELFGWGTGSLLLVVTHALLGRIRGVDRFFFLLCAALWAAYSLYWFSGGPDFGARYWFTMIYPAIWLTVRGAGTLCRRFSVPPMRLVAVILLQVAASCLLFVPWRCAARYLDYRGANPDYRSWVDEGTFDGALVLVKSSNPLDWGNALILNSPTLDGPGPVFALDLGDESNRKLMAAYPKRPVFWVEGRSVAGASSRIVKRAEPGGG